MTIEEKIKKSPDSCGVYIFNKKNGIPLYVGRSINLKQRLKSYVNSKEPKAKALIKESSSLTVIKTKSLIDAVIKEANLIKKFEPKYNVKEKDNRSFCYIEIVNEKWPYPQIIRERNISFNKDKKSLIFGPFQSYKTAKNILSILRKIFPYSTCKENQKKPCFHYSINLCPGKCISEVTKKEYNKNIKYLSFYLKGERKKIESYLKKENPEKLKELKIINDFILSTNEENFLKKWKTTSIEGYDISHFSGKESVGAMVLFEKGNFNKKGYRLFKIKKAAPGNDIAALEEILKRRLKHKEWKYPDLILVDGGKAQVNIFEKIINNNKLKIPVIGIAKNKKEKIVLGKAKIDVSDSDFLNHLKKIRDEVHRFANSFRKKKMSITS